MSQRGVSIPTAMFFVLVCFMISTVMAARAHLDLQVSKYDGLELERDLAARGAAARALVLLNADDEWKEHDSDNRVSFETTETARFNLEGWAQQDADNPLIYHVFGRAFVDGNSDQESISSRVTLRRPDTEGLTFANTSVPGQYQPDSLFYKRGYDAEWTLLPPAPRWTYNDSMVLVEHSGYAGAVNNLAADNQGRMYAHYTSGYDRDDFIGDIYRRKYSDFLNSGNFAEMYRAMPDYVEALGFDLRRKAFGGSVLMRFDPQVSDWEALPAVPNVSYAGGVASINQNQIYDGGVGAIEVTNDSLYTVLYRDGHDAMLRLDLASNTWGVIQPPGGMPEATQSEADDNGNIYAKWATVDRNRSAIYRQSGGSSWEKIPDPPRGQFDEAGNWQPMSGVVTSLGHMDVTPEGKVYAVWNAHDESSSMEYVVYEFSKDSDGQEVWTPMPPAPRFNYVDGVPQALPQGGSSQLVKSLAVDAEDRLIASIDGRGGGVDSMAYQQGEEYIPYDQLPNHVHNQNGELIEHETGHLDPFQAAGGGFVNGQENRYITVYRY